MNQNVKWLIFDGLFAGIGSVMILISFTGPEKNILAYCAGALGLINTPISILLGTYKPRDYTEKR